MKAAHYNEGFTQIMEPTRLTQESLSETRLSAQQKGFAKMKVSITKSLKVFLAAVVFASIPLTVGAAPAAEGGQFYFVARTGAPASLSPGKPQSVVYLRWDLLEGELPSDIQRLRLLRDDQTLLDVDARKIMPAAAIAGLYSDSVQERRLLETVTHLKEYALAQERPFNAGNFATELRERLQLDQLWGYLASRTDINVARARYRAFIDSPEPGTYTYELLGVNDAGETARLGRVNIDTRGTQTVLAPANFRQVYQAACDLPEYAKDHYTVALDWNKPGSTNVTDMLASQVFISGYDLYRTTSNLDPSVKVAPNRDLAAEAAAAPYDSRGRVQLADLEKVNDTLLTITPDASDSPEWLETQDQLSRAGLKPGDHRAYYLVPRDFTGNYGPTRGAMVTVPNLIRPPTPWSLRQFLQEDDSDEKVAISFDRIDLANYTATFGDSLNICNANEAQTSGILEYVGFNESCATDQRRRLRLDVAEYQVYRFPDFRQASEFQDSDGDGVADRDERPNLQCNASQQAEGENYRLDGPLVKVEQVTLPNSGRIRMRLYDATPADSKGRVFWYRIAAKTADGRLSLLTPPVRAMFPDRELPPKPALRVERQGEVDGCKISTAPAKSWTFIDNIGVTGEVALTCGGTTLTGTMDQLRAGISPFCSDLAVTACDGAVGATLSVPINDESNCSVALPDTVSVCGVNTVILDPATTTGKVPVNRGEVVSGSVLITAEAPTEDTCVSIYQTVMGQASQVATSCGSDLPGKAEYETESGFFCGYAVSQDENNNISLAESIPCTQVQPLSPKPPQPRSLLV